MASERTERGERGERGEGGKRESRNKGKGGERGLGSALLFSFYVIWIVARDRDTNSGKQKTEKIQTNRCDHQKDINKKQEIKS